MTTKDRPQLYAVAGWLITVANSAVLHLKAGTTTASTAPLKFTTGTSLTAPVATVLFTWTTNDEIWAEFCYEAA